MDYSVKDNSLVIKIDERASARLSFRIEGERLYLDSTYTPEKYRGRGIGGQLMQAALDFASRRGLKIVPICSFSVEYFNRHVEYGGRLWKG